MNQDLEFAVKKDDSGRYGQINRRILPWEINPEGTGGALVLRYWGCSLRCALCYSQAYAYLNSGGSRAKHVYDVGEVVAALVNPQELRKFADFSVTWTRIQGGEPLMSEKRAFATTLFSKAAFEWMLKQEKVTNPRVVIQTNGILLGQCPEDTLAAFVSMLGDALPVSGKGRLAIEISFKGANPTAAQEYACSMPLPIKVLESQMAGFFRILKVISEVFWAKKENRIALYPVAGIGPQLSDPSFVPIDTESPGLPLFHPNTWSNEFKEIVSRFKQVLTEHPDVYLDYVRAHGNLIPIESMEPSYFQFGWTSQISKRPELKNYIKRNLRICERSRLNLYGKAIEEIPDADNSLRQRIAELKAYFYEAEPSSHYPYL